MAEGDFGHPQTMKMSSGWSAVLLGCEGMGAARILVIRTDPLGSFCPTVEQDQ
jgi:hypothetical protein